jgi:hypothetical protein
MLVQSLSKQKGSLEQRGMREVSGQTFQEDEHLQANEYGTTHHTLTLSISHRQTTDNQHSAC